MSKKEQVLKSFEELLLEIKKDSTEEKFREEYKNLMVDFRETFFGVLDGTVTPKVIKKESTSSNPKWEEEILVVPRNKLFGTKEKLKFEGIATNPNLIDEIITNINDNLQVMRRGGGVNDKAPKTRNAENNEKFKQPIPYVIIKRGNEVYAYERLNQGGETKLHGKISIGVGGHMNEFEGNFDEVLLENTNRELEEELFINSNNQKLEYIGLINDDSDEVGKYHIGILAILELDEDAEVSVRETEQLKGYWTTPIELLKEENRLESWSKFAVNILSIDLVMKESFSNLELKTNIKE